MEDYYEKTSFRTDRRRYRTLILLMRILRPLGQSDTDTAAPDAAQTSAVPDSAQGTGESGGSSTDTKEIEAEEKRLSFGSAAETI